MLYIWPEFNLHHFGSLLWSKRVPISAFGKNGSNTCYFLMNPSFHFNDGLVYWSPKNLWKGFFHPHNGNLISPSPTSLATYLPLMKSSLDYGSMWIACWQALLLGTKGASHKQCNRFSI